MRIQIIIAVILILGLIGIVNAVKKHQLDMKYALSWMFCMLCMLIVDIFPKILVWLSNLIGIDLPINTVLFVGIGFSMLLIFIQTMTISNLSEKTKKLTQEVAILEKRLVEIEENKR